MNRRAVLIGVTLAAVAPPAMAQTRTITRLKGVVEVANFLAFLGRIADASDTVIGLRVWVEPNQPGSRVAEIADDGGEATLSSDETELYVEDGASWSHGYIVLDGFWMAKYSSMNQGIMTYHLTHVDDAVIALNPSLTVIEVDL